MFRNIFLDISKLIVGGTPSPGKRRYIHLIENRFQPLMHIEQLFDDNRLSFRYNPKLNPFSLIEADYLLTSPYEEMIFKFSLQRIKRLTKSASISFCSVDRISSPFRVPHSMFTIETISIPIPRQDYPSHPPAGLQIIIYRRRRKAHELSYSQ